MPALMWRVEAGMPAPTWRVEALLGEPGLLTELCSSSARRVPANGTLFIVFVPHVGSVQSVKIFSRGGITFSILKVPLEETQKSCRYWPFGARVMPTTTYERFCVCWTLTSER